MFVVCWRSLATGATGHGRPISESSARAACTVANSRHRGVIDHWVEPVIDDVLPEIAEIWKQVFDGQEN